MKMSLYIILYTTYLILSVKCLTPEDISAMMAIKLNLGKSKMLNWSGPDPCKWKNVQCTSNRVTSIKLSHVNLSGGKLAEEVNNLTSLQVLQIIDCSLTGPIPSLSRLSSLENLILHNNNFTSLPSDFFHGLISIIELNINHNPSLSPWKIPSTLKEFTRLEAFAATETNLIGTIPEFLGEFQMLKELRLSFHKLEGQLPLTFSNSSIQNLLLNSYHIDSKLNGSISVLENMTSLNQVWLHGNLFTGPIPDLSRLNSLKDLSLRDNRLTGIVPESVVKLPMLEVINLTNNLLQGPTPEFKIGRVDMRPGSNSFCLDEPGANCDERVNVLMSIVEHFGYPAVIAENWKGNNPCKGPWPGLSCEGDDITVVNFQNKGFSGTISPEFAKLLMLKQIFLGGNLLTGTIPDELTSLSHLQKLDLSDNFLHGVMPSFRDNVTVIVDGNPDFGKSESGDSPSGGDKESNGGRDKGKVAGVVVVVVFCGVFAFGIGVWLCMRKRNRGNVNAVKISESDSNTTNDGPGEVLQVAEAERSMVISIQVLRNVTDDFSQENILGKGGFGTVYKGELHDGKKIAVKRMESDAVSEKGLSEFKSEIAVLTKVRHRHLVTLLGYCLEGNEKLLVYEYMPQGTLSRHLFKWRQEGLKPLDWTRRLIIALDVARAVEYLHTLAHQSFIHRDLKPSNILLGDDMRAKVADFGLVRLVPDNCKQSIQTRVAGTFGYLAPEYAVTGRVTTKVDVFSFGVILMELISGRKALDETQPEDSIHLVAWFRRMLVNKDTFQEAIDLTIDLTEETYSSISTVAALAGHCCAREPYQRPDMAHVVNVLSSLAELWKPSEDQYPEDMSGVHLHRSLSQELKKWQASEGSSISYDTSSSFFPTSDNHPK